MACRIHKSVFSQRTVVKPDPGFTDQFAADSACRPESPIYTALIVSIREYGHVTGHDVTLSTSGLYHCMLHGYRRRPTLSANRWQACHIRDVKSILYSHGRVFAKSTVASGLQCFKSVNLLQKFV